MEINGCVMIQQQTERVLKLLISARGSFQYKTTRIFIFVDAMRYDMSDQKIIGMETNFPSRHINY